MSLNSPVILDRICYHVAGHALVEDVSAELPVGSLTCVCGANGSGKSTLIKIILGLIQPTQGSVSIGGYAPAEAVRQLRIGYVPQASSLHGAKNFPATVSDVIRSGSIHTTTKHVRDVMRMLGNDALLHAAVNQLSGGEIQRMLIARALLTQPDVLILDEPTAGLDQAGTRAVYEVLHTLCTEKKTTVIVIEHELDTVQAHADLVIALATRQLAFGTPTEALPALAHIHAQHHTHE